VVAINNGRASVDRARFDLRERQKTRGAYEGIPRLSVSAVTADGVPKMSWYSATYEDGSSIGAVIRYKMRTQGTLFFVTQGGPGMSSTGSVTSHGANSAQHIHPNHHALGTVPGKHGKVHKGHHENEALQQPTTVTNPSTKTVSDTVGTVLNKTA